MLLNSERMPNDLHTPHGPVHALVLAAIGCAVFLRFWPWASHAFFGDDLANYLAYLQGGLSSSFSQAAFGVFFEKYRPVAQTMWAVMFPAFGRTYEYYVITCIVVHMICVAVFYAVALRLSRSWLAAGLLAAAFGLSRFGYFQATTFTGLVESTPVIFLFLALYASLALFAADRPQGNGNLLAYGALVLCVFLAVSSHERYLAATPWMLAVIWAAPGLSSLRPSRRVALMVLSCMPILANLAYKTYAGVPMNVGTGGTSLGIDNLWALLHQAFFTLIGFNSGPAYLVGPSASTLPDYLLGFLFLLPATWLIVTGAKAASRGSRPSLVWLILLVALCGLLLGPALLTIRLEQRWLLASFGLILIGLAWAVGELQGRLRRGAVAAVAVSTLALIGADMLISRGIDWMYLYGSAKVATALMEAVPLMDPEGPVALIVHPDACGWALQFGAFFWPEGGASREINCTISLEEYLANRQSGGPDYAMVYDGINHAFSRTELSP